MRCSPIATLAIVVVVPLAVTSQRVTATTLDEADVHDVLDPWAKAAGWSIVTVNPGADGFNVRATGPMPEPSTNGLRAQLDAHGLSGTTVHLELVPGTLVDLDGG